MNVRQFLAGPDNLEAVRRSVLDVQRELAPEEVEVTESYVGPLIELAAQDRLPAARTADRWGAFGAADWLLTPIVFLVMSALATRLSAGATAHAWEPIAEAEVRAWVRRSGSRRARKLVPELTRSLQSAFRQHFIRPVRSVERPALREERHTDVSCPRQVWIGTPRFSLVVRLTVKPALFSAAESSLDVEPGQAVHVHLQAPAPFEILTAPWQEIAIPPGQDSTPAVFDLRPRETGAQSLVLDFYQGGNPLGTVRVPVEVVDEKIPEAHARARPCVLALGSDVPPPDRVLRITWHPETSSLALTLIQRGGTSWWTPPALRIERDPALWAEELFKELDDLAERSAGRARDVLDGRSFLTPPEAGEALKRLGQNLWRELPEEFQSLYAREREGWRGSSLLILSDEPHLPWELLWPYGGGVDDDEAPWCLTLNLSRWLAQGTRGKRRSEAPGILSLTAAVCVAPDDSHLQAAPKEQLFIQRLLGDRGVQDLSPPAPTLEAIMDLLRAGSFDWFHAVSHGNFSPQAPDQRSVLWLQGRQALTPQHFVGAQIEEGFSRNRPAFVFNLCHAGRMAWGLTGLGGWADRLISCGAGLFLGPLWKVTDEAACQMAESFYELLLDGRTTVAEAARRARLEAYKAGDPTWLAYSLYAHPNARVRPPEAADSSPDRLRTLAASRLTRLAR